MRVDGGLPSTAQHQRIAIRRRIAERLRADNACRAGTVLHHHRLPQRRAQRFGDQPRGNVLTAPGRIGHQDADRTIWIAILCAKNARTCQNARAQKRGTASADHVSSCPGAWCPGIICRKPKAVSPGREISPGSRLAARLLPSTPPAAVQRLSPHQNRRPIPGTVDASLVWH